MSTDFAESAAGPMLELFASLALGDADDRRRAWETLEPTLTGPAELNTALYLFCLLSGVCLESAHPDHAGDFWGYAVDPAVAPDPARDFAARYIVAGMSGDMDRCNDLFFGTDASRDDLSRSSRFLVDGVLTLCATAGRALVESGNRIPPHLLDRLSAGGAL